MTEEAAEPETAGAREMGTGEEGVAIGKEMATNAVHTTRK